MSITVKKKFFHYNKTDHNTLDAVTAQVSGTFRSSSAVIGDSELFVSGVIVINSSLSGSSGTIASDFQEDDTRVD